MAGQTPSSAAEARQRAHASPWFERAVRAGLVAYGVTHLLVAWLAGRLALGDPSGEPSQTGALAELSQQPAGTVLLWLVGLGFLTLVLWQALEALAGHREHDGWMRWAHRAVSAGRAVVFGVLGVAAVRVATGSGSGGGDDTEGLTARLLAAPAGPFLVAAVGLGVLGVAAAHVYKGFAETFMDRIDPRGESGGTGRVYRVLGKVGFVAKGVAFTVVALLFLWAAWTHDPDKSGGLDQALQTVRAQPLGTLALLLIAAGIACFGLFCFAWARHRDD